MLIQKLKNRLFDQKLIPFSRLLLVVVLFMALNELLAEVLAFADIRFPSSVAGMVIVFLGMAILHSRSQVFTERLFDFCGPAVQFMGRWMALFFVPPLVVIPAAEIPLENDLWKLIVIMTGGFLFTLVTTAWMVHVFSGNKKRIITGTVIPSVPPVRLGLWLRIWIPLLIISGFFSIYLMIEGAGTAFFLTVSIVGFLIGLRFQEAFGKVGASTSLNGIRRALISFAHPVLFSAVLTIVAIEMTGYPYGDYLNGNDSGIRAGNLLMSLLDPAVMALGFLLYRERMLLVNYAREILLSLGFASLFALFSSAVAARVLGMDRLLALAVIPRAVTTPIAIPIAELLGTNPGITAALVVLTGVLGAVFGQPLLDMLKADNPVVRGVAMGASAHGIGTAALVRSEPSAAAISGISFALMAALSAAAVSLNWIYESLLTIIGN